MLSRRIKHKVVTGNCHSNGDLFVKGVWEKVRGNFFVCFEWNGEEEIYLCGSCNFQGSRADWGVKTCSVWTLLFCGVGTK